MASSNGRNNIRTQPLYLPNSQDPAAFNIPESEWRYPGMVGGSATIVLGNDSTTPSTNPRGSKTIQLVRTDSTMTVAPYESAVAWWQDRLTYRVTTAATNRGQVAGVFLGPVTPGNLAIIQTAGRRAVKFVDAPTSAPDASGKFVIPSATAGKADCVATAPTFPIMGLTAGTSGPSAEALVDLAIPQQT